MIRINISWKIPLSGSIIDFESTHYDATRGELITAGFLSKDGFTILQRVKTKEDHFKNQIIEEMNGLERPFYAFNKTCEEGFCAMNIDHDLQVEREAAFIALKNEGILKLYDYLSDPLFNEEVPRFWEAWKTTGDPLFLSKIVRHNYCCLAKEYYLKRKRIDRVPPQSILPFPSSAPIEKRYIRPNLGVYL